MQKHDNVIKAWLEGEAIQRYDPIDDVWVSSVNEWLNPTYFDQYDRRIKPELKQVDYQALIDAKLFVTLFSHRDSRILTSRLADFDEYYVYIDKMGGGLGSMEFEDGLKQVTTTNNIHKLWKAGFSVEVEGSYDCNKLKDELYVVVLEGVREGYTL
jgi:hypothetical protein